MPNRLADSLSPYLEQHAHNPVDWYPWGPEALDAARTSDRPVLLSIGYSACHWCHVMAHESFEDTEIAERMNAWFVSIKIDREERPDIDRVYQIAHQLLTGRGGGWPLTVFVDPSDLAPFVAGTYFPPTARHGLIGFGELLERVHDAWMNRRDTLKAQNRQLIEALTMISSRRTPPGEDGEAPDQVLLGQLDARRDHRHGGFGDAPKFPQAPLLEWLLDVAASDEQAEVMLGDTLRAMGSNGLFDHLGGGFFRYCVDAAWEIPHFEKMLGDNALLLPLYAEAAVRWNDSDWTRVAEATARFLADDLRLPDGGLASSLDADSVPPDPDPGQPAEPREGAHYLWTPGQFEACLGGDRLELARARFGLDGPANFEGRQWHLVCARAIDELTDTAGDADRVRAELERARAELLECRRRRPAPTRDEKMLAAANALAAVGLMRAGRLMGQDEWVDLGMETAELVWQRLFADGPANAVWRDGRRDHPALLDDYAAVLLASIETLECAWNSVWLERAETLAATIRDRFFDADAGALYLTPDGHERLIMRPNANIDDAAPAGAAVAARAMLRLGHLVTGSEWLELAGRIVETARGDMQRSPMAHATLLLATREADRPRPQVLIGGPGDEADQWRSRLRRRPGIHCFRVTDDGTKLPGILAEVAGAGQPTAVVCIGTRCLEPATTPKQLEQRLEDALDTAGPVS